MTTTIVLEVIDRWPDWFFDDVCNRVHEWKWRWRYHQERESGAEPWIDLGGEG